MSNNFLEKAWPIIVNLGTGTLIQAYLTNLTMITIQETVAQRFT